MKENQIALRPATIVCRERGISDVTLWRWEKRGWIRTSNINGRKYVIMASLQEFDRRAIAGEFARRPRGAALLSSYDSNSGSIRD